MLKSKLRNGKKYWLPLLLLLLAALLGCSPPLQQSTAKSASLPSMPLASTPQPLVPYLETVNANISKWEKMLQDTLLIPSSTSKAGPSK